MATAAKVQIALEAQTAQLKKGFGEARQSIDRLGKGLSGNVAMGMAKFHAGLLAAKAALGAVRGAVNGLLQSMAGLDEQQKFADRLGMSADALRVLELAANRTGVGVNALRMGIQRMDRRVAEAATGSGEAVKALDELGLSAREMAQLNTEQKLGVIADALGSVETHSDKVRLAFKLFDSQGVALVNTLAGGSEGLNKFADEAGELGVLMGDSRRDIEAANDAIAGMKDAWGAFVAQVAIAVAPALEAIANFLAEIIGFFNRLTGRSEAARKKLSDFGASAKSSVKLAAGETNKLEKAMKDTEDRTKKVARSMEKTAKASKGIQVPDYDTPGIGAVTGYSVAGFSAVQAANRAARDAERRHREHMARLDEMIATLAARGIVLAGVGV